MSLDFIKNNPFGMCLSLLSKCFNHIFNVIQDLALNSYIYAIPIAIFILLPVLRMLFNFILIAVGVDKSDD